MKKAKKKVKERFVLVGTYKGDQLTKWRGWYNYPISARGDTCGKSSRNECHQ